MKILLLIPLCSAGERVDNAGNGRLMLWWCWGAHSTASDRQFRYYEFFFLVDSKYNIILIYLSSRYILISYWYKYNAKFIRFLHYLAFLYKYC